MKAKQISYENALKRIKCGEAVKCQTGFREDVYEPITDEKRLDYLHKLTASGVLNCKFFAIPEKKNKDSEKVIELTFDDAVETLGSGIEIFYKNKDDEEEKISNLSQLISLRRTADLRGEKLLLYWYE